MNEFRTRALSCLAVATLLVVHASANAAVITIDTDEDGLASGNRGGEFDWRDGYVELFGFNTYQGYLTDIAWDLSFSQVEPTVTPGMFSIIFMESGNPGVIIGQIGDANYTRRGAGDDPTIEGVTHLAGDGYNVNGDITATDAATYDLGTSGDGGLAESTGGFTFMNWTNGTNIGDTTLSGSIDITQEYLTPTVGTYNLTNYDAANIAAYYFNGYTAGKVNDGNADPPSGDWNGTITFASTGGTTGGAVPEPSTATMVAMGMMTLLGGLRRRRR